MRTLAPAIALTALALAIGCAPAHADFFDDVRRTFQTDIPRTFQHDIPRAFGADKPDAKRDAPRPDRRPAAPSRPPAK